MRDEKERNRKMREKKGNMDGKEADKTEEIIWDMSVAR